MMVLFSMDKGDGMKKLWRKAGRGVGILLAILATAQFACADETQFTKSSTSFFNETEVFNKESQQLIDNTQEVDTVLIELEKGLSVPHKVATALKKLDDTLSTIKKMLAVAKLVPQTKEKAEELEKKLDVLKTKVSTAAENAAKVDKAVDPVWKATGKTENVASDALEFEKAFRIFALGYIDGIEGIIQCSDKKPEIEPKIIPILDNSKAAFHAMDPAIHKVNQTYADTVALPEKALKATMAEIMEQIKELEKILSALTGLQDQLDPLNDVLAELKKIMDKSLGFSFDYPCGAKICTESTPYPCGTKTCKKYGVKYPCGVKICHKDVPYPCGVNTCSAKVSMSLSTVINGADAIEHKIESVLSSTAWEALKVIGVKKYVDDLKKEADSLLKPVLSKLHLDISTNLPDLTIHLTTVKVNALMPNLTLLDSSILQIGKSIDMKAPAFAPQISKLQLLDKDIQNLLKIPGCQAAPAKPPAAKSKRINWRKPFHM